MPTRRLALAFPLAFLAATTVPAQVPTCSTPTSTGVDLNLRLLEPLPGTTPTVGPPCCEVFLPLNGNAAVGLPLFDFYFVVDSSGSTANCSGEDIDDDGETGVPDIFGDCSDPDDTILAAELRAVRDFVATLTPASSRVSISQFSNPEGFFGLGERQRTVQALTNDFALVDAALDEIFLFGSAGATDYGGGLDLIEADFLLNGDPVNRRQLAYLLSDGIPTYPQAPYSSEEPDDSKASIDSADRLAADGIEVDTFGVGFVPTVTQDPILPARCEILGVPVSTLECIASRSGGDFFASSDPLEIVERLKTSVPPLGIDSVEVFNDSTGRSAGALLTADGSWSAELEVHVNRVNVLRAVAIAEDGTPCEVTTFVEPLCEDPPLPPLTLQPLMPLPPMPPMSPMSPLSPLSPLSPCSPASPGSSSSSAPFR